jgi:hypothetical protein
MLGWLKRLFVPEDRLLFHYWDGQKARLIDPLVANRAIFTIGDFAEDCKVASNPLKDDGQGFYKLDDVLAAEDSLRDRTRQVFGVKPWSESTPGLTLQETDDLLCRFLAFRDEVKKKLKHSPTSSAPSESREPAKSPDIVAFPDCAESVSPSTPSVSIDVAPFGP